MVVAVHRRSHRRVGTVHRLEARALPLGSQGKWSGQRASSVLVVCKPESDDADDDDDYGDEGNDAANNANDNCVHVSKLRGTNLLGQL